MSEEIPNLFEIMATTRSMRRLKPDPVPAPLIRKILEAGVSAPSGGNMQRWRFLVVRNPKIKQTVGAYYKRAWDEVVVPRYRAGEPAPGTSRERFARMLDAAQYLADHIHESPGVDCPVPRRGEPDPHLGLIDLSSDPEHAAGGASPRSRCDVDNALLELRERGRGRFRLAARRALLCAPANRLSNGPIRAGSSRPPGRCRL